MIRVNILGGKFKINKTNLMLGHSRYIFCAWISHCNNLQILRVTLDYPDYSFMCNPPLIILSAFHWLSKNSKPRVFFTHHLSTFKCKHCSLFTIYVCIFKHIQSWNSKYPGFCCKWRKNSTITQGNPELPWVFSLMLVEYKNNLPKIP